MAEAVTATKWYEESPGVVSSKRIAGAATLSLGVAMKLTCFVWALFAPLGDAATASAQADGLVLAGSTLLGITGLDVFKRAN
jgi:hypothetical protein